MPPPNILFIMTDQQRFDTIAALGAGDIHTPNLDRLVRRGVSFTRAYSESPVCVPARYTIRTGCSPLRHGYFQIEPPVRPGGDPRTTEDICGPYLARAMRQRGYRTFGIGKFHTMPRTEDIGYETYLRCEEHDGHPDDDYMSFVSAMPAYAHLEQLHGERTNMYYVPQTSALPAALTAEAWGADRAIEQIAKHDGRPYFGFVSFVGPHPPFAPPVPYNRMYDPDRMRDPVFGPPEIDLMDERVPWNSYFIYAEDVSVPSVRALRSRYYGEITFIDACIGRILNAVEARPDADNTVICFFADHGEFLGDHRQWQKENFFEESTHIPFLLSWPQKLPSDQRCEALAGLSDLFGLATTAAGQPELRDGVDLLGVARGEVAPRETLFGFTSAPGDLNFRAMVRSGDWKYVFHANGGGELLFNLKSDPREHVQRLGAEPAVAQTMRDQLRAELARTPVGRLALGDDGRPKVFPRTKLPLTRCKQFNTHRGVRDFGYVSR